MPKIAKIAVVFPSKTSAADEKGLAKCFDAMLVAQKDIDGVLEEVGKTKPMPDPLEVDLKKRLKIATSRAAEMKDMAKDRKAGTLHSNPGKLSRLYDDLNSDVAQANWLEGGVGKALDDHFGDLVDKLETTLEASLPSGVTTKHFDFKGIMKAFREKNSKEHWAKYDENVKKLEKAVKKEADAVEREQALKAVGADKAFSTLKYAIRQKAVEAALKSDTETPTTLRTTLEDLLDKQRKPSKSQWASYLNLGAGGSYSLKSSGSFQGMAIHLTMSKDSWTSDADGKVTVTDSAQTIYENLLKVVDWKQLHATLEVSKNAADFPHVFLFAGVLGNDTRWEAARVLLNRDGKWVGDAQKAVAKELGKLETTLLSKIAEAKKQDGANVN
ncbi:hypothetical protein GC209_19620 [bacterium]|nr:hypothetical protein [bacterium]